MITGASPVHSSGLTSFTALDTTVGFNGPTLWDQVLHARMDDNDEKEGELPRGSPPKTIKEHSKDDPSTKELTGDQE